RDRDHHGGDLEVSAHGGDHRVEAAQQADGRDRRGQQEDSAAQRAFEFESRLAALTRIERHPQALFARAAGIAAHCSIAPMMDSPARTRCPSDTVTRYSDGKK